MSWPKKKTIFFLAFYNIFLYFCFSVFNKSIGLDFKKLMFNKKEKIGMNKFIK